MLIKKQHVLIAQEEILLPCRADDELRSNAPSLASAVNRTNTYFQLPCDLRRRVQFLNRFHLALPFHLIVLLVTAHPDAKRRHAA